VAKENISAELVKIILDAFRVTQVDTSIVLSLLIIWYQERQNDVCVIKWKAPIVVDEKISLQAKSNSKKGEWNKNRMRFRYTIW